MPVIEIKWYEGRSREQKEEIARQITKTMVEVGKMTPEHVWIVFENVPRSEWSIGGKLQDKT